MEKHLFTIQNVETGKLNALVNNIMKQIGVDDPNEAIRMVNAGEVQINQKYAEYIEKDSIISFSVPSDGTTGEQWIPRLEGKGIFIDSDVKEILCSKDFKPTDKMIYEVAVIKGAFFNNDDDITTNNIRIEGNKRKFITPNIELACLIREKFNDEKILKTMGLYWIIIMHRPIKYSGDCPIQLGINCSGSNFFLSVCRTIPNRKLRRHNGFAFIRCSKKVSNL
jgi:hypothetical protein